MYDTYEPERHSELTAEAHMNNICDTCGVHIEDNECYNCGHDLI